MHYRNGREAKNGDKIVQLSFEGGKIVNVGVLFDATSGNDFCNGSIAPIAPGLSGACMCDCLHMDDVAEMLKEKGFDKRPAGKYATPSCGPSPLPPRRAGAFGGRQAGPEAVS